jgi:hypothetical protein
MSFQAGTYANFVADSGAANTKLFPQYSENRSDFDIIIIGSGIGGGILADDLADRLGTSKRILVLEAGSYLYPTHVYNICRFPNSTIAQKFGCRNFSQPNEHDDTAQFYIGLQPQMNLGGRSVFWSGLIPTVQSWELEFFPPAVKNDLANGGLFRLAGETMNQSVSMGTVARQIVDKLRVTDLANDFEIEETPRALHQPYLKPDGTLVENFFTEPTGVFNTAELLINQSGFASRDNTGTGGGMHLLLNHFAEDIQRNGNGYTLVVQDTLTNITRPFFARTVVIAGGSIESPKLLRRSSSLFNTLPGAVQQLAGLGLTDHPTTNEATAFITSIDNVDIPKDTHAKIILYSKGLRDGNNQTKYPFNVEININHEYWHLRENDPNAMRQQVFTTDASRLDMKFSFGNCLDDGNRVGMPEPFGYVPEITFRNQRWMDHLRDDRFPRLAGWNKSYEEIFAVLNEVTFRLLSKFRNNGQVPIPVNDQGEENWFGENGKGFGYGTVHHSTGTLRMPYRPHYLAPFDNNAVVDENLQVNGAANLYVCDLSVMPFSSAANPVRTLAALALRLSQRLAT